MSSTPVRAPARARRATLGRSRRAFTLTEMIVVLAIMGTLTAVALPRLLSGDALGQDQRAKTTGSAAAGSVTRLYRTAVAAQPWDSDLLAQLQSEQEAQLGRPLTTAEVAALPRPPRRPDIDPAALASVNPDLKFLAAATASTEPETVSVGSRLVGTPDQVDAYWVIGLAMDTPPAPTSSAGGCWMVQLALNPPAGVRLESYLLFEYHQDSSSTSAANPDGDQCTGQTAAGLDVAALKALPQNSTTTSPARGSAWSRPLNVPASAVTAAQPTP